MVKGKRVEDTSNTVPTIYFSPVFLSFLSNQQPEYIYIKQGEALDLECWPWMQPSRRREQTPANDLKILCVVQKGRARRSPIRFYKYDELKTRMALCKTLVRVLVQFKKLKITTCSIIIKKENSKILEFKFILQKL